MVNIRGNWPSCVQLQSTKRNPRELPLSGVSIWLRIEPFVSLFAYQHYIICFGQCQVYLKNLFIYKFRLNKIAARWPVKAVAQFFIPKLKSSGNQVLIVVLLSYDTKQSNRIDIPTAYDKNNTLPPE